MAKVASAATRRAMRRLGSHISVWRKFERLTMAQVAERANIARTTYSRLEHGQDVSLEAFVDVARSLGILDRLLDALDPYESDLGRARSDESLPQRIRRQ